MNAHPFYSLGFGLILIAAPTMAQPNETRTPPLPLDRQVTEIAARLVGVMEVTPRNLTGFYAPPIRMTTCPIQVTGGEQQGTVVFLYQEQAALSTPDRPYRQRFLRIAPSLTKTSVESRAFKPKVLQSWVRFCDRPMANREVVIQDLGTAVCSVYLKPSGTDYIGRTGPDGCPAQYRGAVRITNRIVLCKDGMETWDRGFDASGKQVWGAEDYAYQFRRIKVEERRQN